MPRQYRALLQEVHSSLRQHVLRALQILEVAQQGLTTDDLAYAMFVDIDNWNFLDHHVQDNIWRVLTSSPLFETRAVQASGPGIDSRYWDEEQGTFCMECIRLAPRYSRHQSGDDYNSNRNPWTSQAHATVARICLIYLMHCDPPSSQPTTSMTAFAAYGAEYQLSDWRDSHPFATYAARYWPAHSLGARYHNVTGQDALETTELALLDSPEYVDQWLRIQDVAASEIRMSPAPKRAGWFTTHNPIYQSAFYGLESTTRALLDRYGAVVTTESLAAATEALQAACFQGHVQVAELLISFGASPDDSIGPFDSAVIAAAAGGAAAVLSMLFVRGVSLPEEADESHPLVVAAVCGDPSTTSFLLRSLGENAQEIMDYALGSVLQRSEELGDRFDVIQVLTEAGAQSAM